MKSLKWLGYGLLIIGLSLAIISALAPAPADNSAAAAGTPPAAPGWTGWHTVGTWRGDSTTTTRVFSVSDPWRIRWNAGHAEQGVTPFRIRIYDQDGDEVGTVANGTRHDESILHRAGSYHLQIVGAQPYTVTVQEKA